MRTVGEITAAAKEIEAAARININFIVNNTNLGRETKIEHVREGLEIAVAAADRLKIGVAFSSVLDDLSGLAREHLYGPRLPVKMFFNPPWV
jgi:alkanesulfonate monooxygenase SsuD/methylene tetrahydromethanopterin reductase-like flavin-dependent oxidoreductase (luciferase family)